MVCTGYGGCTVARGRGLLVDMVRVSAGPGLFAWGGFLNDVLCWTQGFWQGCGVGF